MVKGRRSLAAILLVPSPTETTVLPIEVSASKCLADEWLFLIGLLVELGDDRLGIGFDLGFA
jgi:hypothetical protein